MEPVLESRVYPQNMTGENKKRLKKFFILVTIATLIYLSNGLRHLGYTGTPDWVDACGRSYVRPHEIISRDKVMADEPVIIGTVQVWFRHLNIWGRQPSYKTGYLSCGGSVYVEFSENEFRQYTISGGF